MGKFPSTRGREKIACKTNSSEEDFSHQHQGEPREPCAEQVTSLWGQRQISSQQFHLNSCSKPPQTGATRISTALYSLLAMTFHSRPCLGAVHDHQDSHVIEGGMFSCALSCGKTISPSLWILCKTHRWQTQPNPKSAFKSEIHARPLLGTSLSVCFFFSYIYIFIQRRCT